jgi:hypothetical protein
MEAADVDLGPLEQGGKVRFNFLSGLFYFRITHPDLF